MRSREFANRAIDRLADRHHPPGVAIPANPEQAMTLYMLKAVISGRGDEVIDLAKTNLWR